MNKAIRFLLGLSLALSLWTSAASAAGEWIEKGKMFESQQLWSEAFSAYSEAVKREPNNALAYYRLGVVNEKLGSPDAAVRAYQDALRLDSNMNEARLALAGYYVNQGVAQRLRKELDQATTSFRTALSYNTTSADAHFELGQTLDQNGQTGEAIAEYQEATTLDPNKSTAHLRLAKAYAAQGQQENAVKEYQEVLRLNPEDPAAHHGLGVAYNELGQKDQAIASLQQAVRFYLIAGQRDKAQPAYDLQKKLMAEKYGQQAAPATKKKK